MLLYTDKIFSIFMYAQTGDNQVSVKYSINTYVRYLNYALLIIAELPNDELTGNHTLNLPPLCL